MKEVVSITRVSFLKNPQNQRSRLPHSNSQLRILYISILLKSMEKPTL